MASKALKNKLVNGVRPAVLKANEKLGKYKDLVWLLGSGRSGTTWVSDMLNYKRGYREMIEPFRPLLIDEMKFLSLNQYVRPGVEFQQLDDIVSKIFSGGFTHPDVDSANKRLSYRGILVKDVFANLLAYHVVQKTPQIKPALLLRNPFEVALSKQKKSHWNWTTDPRDFLKQQELVEDYLQPFVELIERVGAEGDPIAKHIAVWCIINYVPLKQFKKDQLYVLFYEDMAENTQAEVIRFWEAINPAEANRRIVIPEKALLKPSSVSMDLGSSKKSMQTDWLSKISNDQYRNGMEILEAFGLGELYREGRPIPHAIGQIFTH